MKPATIFGLCVFFAFASGTTTATEPWGLQRGTPDLQSATALAFGPDDVLFVGDTKSAAVFAIGTGDKEGNAPNAALEVRDISQAVGDLAGSDATIHDLAVNPQTGTAFLSVSSEQGPLLIQVSESGKLSPLSLEDVPYSRADLADAPEDKGVQRGRRRRNPRNDAITDIAFFENRLLVSGLRGGDTPSSIREFSFPFSSIDRGTGIAIYHAAHGRSEDYSAARTFVTLNVDGEPHLLAAYICTPLVKIPLKDLQQSAGSVQGTTVAELGNRNRPLDMISYTRDGADYLLLSNSSRGVMKISTSGLGTNDGLSEPVRGGGTAGQAYETVNAFQGVVQMDRLGDDHAVVLVQSEDSLDLKTLPLP